jgi:thiamine monophosphate synthase
VVFGRLFDTRAKRVLGPWALAQACSCSIPVIALGGIDNRNAESYVRMGAYGIAVIHSVVAVDDARIALQGPLSVRLRTTLNRNVGS